jgi:hypothetical protein
MLRYVVLMLSCGMLCSCANLLSVERTEQLPDRPAAGDANATQRGTVLMIDAKQRIIYTVWKPSLAKGGSLIPVYCAEPSPDVLDSITSSTKIELTPAQLAQLSLEGGLSDQASSIARTQSVQLMRDIMFRECEAYVNGSNKDISFMTDHRRLISSMVSILAIEQLTDAAKGAQAGEQQAQHKDNADADGDESDKGTGADDQKGGSDTSKSSSLSTNVKTLIADVKSEQKLESKLVSDNKLADTTDGKGLSSAVKKTQSDAATTTKLLAATAAPAQNEAGKSEAPAKNSSTPQPAADQGNNGSTAPSASIGNVALAVEHIVHQTLNLPLTRELCVAVLESPPTDAPSTNTDTNIYKQCFSYLQASVSALDNQQKAYGDCVLIMEKIKSATTQSSVDKVLSTYKAFGCQAIVGASAAGSGSGADGEVPGGTMIY